MALSGRLSTVTRIVRPYQCWNVIRTFSSSFGVSELQWDKDAKTTGTGTRSMRGALEMSVARLVTVVCLECNEPIELEVEPASGQIIACTACCSEMEVVGVNPVKLEFYYDGDWDDEELEEEDDWRDYRNNSA